MPYHYGASSSMKKRMPKRTCLAKKNKQNKPLIFILSGFKRIYERMTR